MVRFLATLIDFEDVDITHPKNVTHNIEFLR